MRSFWPRAITLLVCLAAIPAPAAQSSVDLAKFTGVASCQSSGCHGGGAGKDQCAIWAAVDFHIRAFAILLTPRSVEITKGLKEAAPTENVRCTVCHAPLAAISPARLLPAAHADQGVSCESCHGPASGWLRSHTRTDYTYAERLASGMSDLRSPYGRANTCVACHEYLAPEIVKAGHPVLVFELDSQTVSEPPHWHDADPWIGLHAWLAGQAVAFREETWHMLKKEPGSSTRWEALGWLLEESSAGVDGLGSFSMPRGGMDPGQLAGLESSSDRLARTAAQFPWSTATARRLLQRLAGAGQVIRRAQGIDAQVRRAEVLAQGMDRLVVALNSHGLAIPGADKGLDTLFADLRLPDSFDQEKFSQDLESFRTIIGRE